nr:methyltransferase domain-containing protein [Candidatus Dependentiae bacterium]
ALDIVSYFNNKSLSKNKSIDLKIYDGKIFPFGNKIFDVIISNDTFEHLRFPECVIRECNRVLKKNGLLITQIDLRDHYNLDDEKNIFECLKYSKKLWEMMTINRTSYVNRLRFSDWKKLFSNINFEIKYINFEKNEYIKKNYRQINYLTNFNEDDACIQRLNCVLEKIND